MKLYSFILALTVTLAACAVVAADTYKSDVNEREQLMLSSASYCTPNAVETWNCVACQEIDYIEHPWLTYTQKTVDDSAGLVGWDPKSEAVIVAARGTANVANWLSNLNAFAVPFEELNNKSIVVHDGFYQFFKLMKDEIKEKVESILKKIEQKEKETGKKMKRNLFITGHSRGGAIATLLGAYLVHLHDWDSVKYVTFGAPRVFNKAGADWMASKMASAYRVTHSGDPVPWVPPIEGGYEHFGEEVFYNKQYSSYTLCKDNAESAKKCSMSVNFLQMSINDHIIYDNVHVAHWCTEADKERRLKELEDDKQPAVDDDDTPDIPDWDLFAQPTLRGIVPASMNTSKFGIPANIQKWIQREEEIVRSKYGGPIII